MGSFFLIFVKNCGHLFGQKPTFIFGGHIFLKIRAESWKLYVRMFVKWCKKAHLFGQKPG